MISSSQRKWALFLILIGFFIVLIGCPLLGSTSISFSKVFQAWPPAPGNQDAQIFFQVRLARNLLAALTGAAMAVAGVVFQAVLRNPLACPFTLGIAGGSSFGAVAAIGLGLTAGFGGISMVTLFAFAGALLSIGMVYFLASLIRSFSATTLLLAGVGINYFFSALVLLFYFTADFSQSFAMMHWLMGSLDVVDFASVGGITLVFIISFLIIFSLSRELNLLSAGEELARVKGVPTVQVILLSVFTASFLTSAVVAMTGPIAFVGLIVPHICRLLLGNDHRGLLVGSALGGATFLMLCDTLCRSLFGTTELPVGVLTALIGVPVLLILLFKRRTYVQS
jgi:iron complex transport system permease protein